MILQNWKSLVKKLREFLTDNKEPITTASASAQVIIAIIATFFAIKAYSFTQKQNEENNRAKAPIIFLYNSEVLNKDDGNPNRLSYCASLVNTGSREAVDIEFKIYYSNRENSGIMMNSREVQDELPPAPVIPGLDPTSRFCLEVKGFQDIYTPNAGFILALVKYHDPLYPKEKKIVKSIFLKSGRVSSSEMNFAVQNVTSDDAYFVFLPMLKQSYKENKITQEEYRDVLETINISEDRIKDPFTQHGVGASSSTPLQNDGDTQKINCLLDERCLSI